MKKKSTPPSLVFVYGDDWEGLYVDGKLAVEGHSLFPGHIIDALGLDAASWEADLE